MVGNVTDERLLYEAMYFYARHRWNFAVAISQKGFRYSSGKKPTADDARKAIKTATRCDAIVSALSKDMDSGGKIARGLHALKINAENDEQ